MKILNVLIVSIIFSISFCQIANLSQIYTPNTLATKGSEFNDPHFIKLISNYFGCKKWTDGQCTECSSGFVFNNKGICCIVDQYCEQFNSAVGICEKCYTGYSVSSNGSCIITLSDASNRGCASWKGSICNKCSVRFYFNQKNSCTPISDNCREWNSSGQCTSCYYGYQVLNGDCVASNVSSNNQNFSLNSLCSSWKKSTCISCSHRTYFDTKGICQKISDNCNTWDRHTGVCLSCYKGYDLVNESCIYSPSNTAPTSDNGCKTWINNICTQCSKFWVFNAKQICIPVSDLCKSFDKNGNCLTCYHGYDLVNGSCIYSESNNIKPPNSGCKSWDWKNSKCLSCSSKWVFDLNGICIPVNDFCRTHDDSGACTSCYRGYENNNGKCQFSTLNSNPLSDDGCKIWDWDNNSCKVCSDWWIFKNGKCTSVSSLCKTFDQTNGECLSCFKGYELNNKTCVNSSQKKVSPTDFGCKTWENGICKQCSKYFSFNAQGVCTAVSDECKTYNGLICTSCWNGYTLNNGSCIRSIDSAPSDAGCSLWDWANQVCFKCSFNWVFQNGVCIPVSDQCKNSEALTGLCTTCYKGYDLQNGKCVISSKNSKPADSGCAHWKWDEQICLSCSPYYYLTNGTCQSVSPYCQGYDLTTGKCTSCFKGYILNNGQCNSQISVCKTKKSNGVCLTCNNGYALYQGQCVPISSIADFALYYAACCPQKLAQLQAEGRIPK